MGSPFFFKFHLKNVKLAFLALLVMSLFIGLGCWQLSRAQQKKTLILEFKKRSNLAPIREQQLNNQDDLRFYPVEVAGKFDNQHHVLLDNKTFHGQVGYELYTPFLITKSKQWILVDRGFIPLGSSRKILPHINSVEGEKIIKGMLNQAPRLFSLGKMQEGETFTWPLRLQYIDLGALSTLMNRSLFSQVIILSPQDSHALLQEWQIVTMSPERHVGYAIQWFALALTLLILFIALNCGYNKGAAKSTGKVD